MFIVDAVSSKEVNGIEVLEYEKAKEKYKDLEVVIGIGEPFVRKTKIDKLSVDGVKTTTLIHPDVYISDTAEIGEGVVIQYGCFISCNTVIENFAYIQPQCNIAHDAVVKEGCVISASANFGGGVEVGAYSYIGMSAVLKERIKIGEWSIVGMGSVVCKDMPKEKIIYGNPAKIVDDNVDKKVFKR